MVSVSSFVIFGHLPFYLCVSSSIFEASGISVKAYLEHLSATRYADQREDKNVSDKFRADTVHTCTFFVHWFKIHLLRGNHIQMLPYYNLERQVSHIYQVYPSYASCKV